MADAKQSIRQSINPAIKQAITPVGSTWPTPSRRPASRGADLMSSGFAVARHTGACGQGSRPPCSDGPPSPLRLCRDPQLAALAIVWPR
eukprot:6418397-Prymnesium_polylepis.1